ncbi:hypothetical protein FRB90_004494 [Tulasnella sp. 427]|nr:hypothetical protein FRB90_004494 [Tulasnella sp. 427]
MPRDGTSEASRKMGRHQACHRCRRRKLKWQVLITSRLGLDSYTDSLSSMRPTTVPEEPSCAYDHPDLITDGPKGRIVHLEIEIAELREQLDAANAKLACCTCGAAAESIHSILVTDHEGLSPFSMGGSQQTSSGTTPQHLEPTTDPSVIDVADVISFPGPTVSQSSDNTISLPNPLGITVDIPTTSNQTSGPHAFFAGELGSATLDVFPASWPPNIPPPVVLYHLVETFFASVPLASRLIHKPTFMASLRQLPTSLDFPHIALLHAICGLASLYSPIITDPTMDKTRAEAAAGVINPSLVSFLDVEDGEHGRKQFPKTLFDLHGAWDEGFGASHIRLASMTLRLSVREGDRLLQMLQGVYCSEGFEPLSRLPPGMLFLFGRPKTPIEAETIRNVFWISYAMERVYNAGTAWPLTITDEDISQMMPCRFADFITGEHVPTHNRQRLFTENMLFTHPTLTTDSWTLYIKATMLLSRVKSFNCRYRIVAASKRSDVFTTGYNSPTETEEFQHIDQTISAYMSNIPRAFREPVGATVDPLLYMAHLLPHVAMIQLHDPHAKPISPNDRSAMQMLVAVRAILDLIYQLSGTTYDLLYMDHGCSFGWFVAGAALIRFIRAKMETKEEDEVTRLEQELGIVKFMLRNLGDRTIIGHRQIVALNDIYKVEVKGHRRKAATTPSATDQRVQTDNLIVGRESLYVGLTERLRGKTDPPASPRNGNDGSLPCESCRRAHAYELKTRPATAAAEPKCEYDHPDIVAEGPKGRIARLESRIAELQAQLGFANARLSRCRCGGSAGDVDFSSLSDHPSSRIVPVSAVPNSSRDPLISAATRTRTTRNALPTMGQSMPAPPPIEAFLLPPSPWNTESPPLPIFSPGLVRLEEIDAETFDILPSPWPLNIPPPAVLDHLVNIFFSSVPLASRLVHKPTFMIALRQVPASPEFPHVALLHAICGLASIYSPIIDDRRKEPDGAHLSSFNSAIVFRPQAETGAGARKKHYFPRTLEDVMDEAGEEGFGASHIRWAAASLRLSVQKGDRLLQLLQGRSLIVYILAHC